MSEIKNQINVIHVVGGMERGGTETMIMNLYRYIDRSKLSFSFLSHIKKKCSYDDEILTMGGKIFHVTPLGQIGLLRYLHELIVFFKENKWIDVVHIHTNYQSGIVALAARFAGIKVRFVHSHSANWPKNNNFTNNIVLFILRWLIKFNATDLIACSKEAARFLFSFKTTKEITYIKNSIDFSLFEKLTISQKEKMRLDNNISNETLVIGHIGRFEKVKNHDFIIQIALELLEKKYSNFRIILVGNGSLYNEVKKKIHDYNLEKYFSLFGIREDIAEILNMMDVFILPSFYEGLPLTVIEAQTIGLPCYVSKSITTECDLGMGLINYVELEKGPQHWAQLLMNSSNVTTTEKSKRFKIVTEKGFNARENVNELTKLYYRYKI